MTEVSSAAKEIGTSFKPLESGSCFISDTKGHRVVALRLAGKVAREISGQEMILAEGILTRLRSAFRHEEAAGRWLIVTSVENPLLEQLDNYMESVAHELAQATRTQITNSDLAVCATVPINGREQIKEIDENNLHDQASNGSS